MTLNTTKIINLLKYNYIPSLIVTRNEGSTCSNSKFHSSLLADVTFNFSFVL